MEAWCFGLLVAFKCWLPVTPPADTFCDLYGPVYLSHADTRGTKEQTDRNNRKYKARCSGGKIKK